MLRKLLLTAGLLCAAWSANAQSGGGSVTITRPNDTSAYAANDVIGSATGSTAAVQFTDMSNALGTRIMITSARFTINDTAVISGETSYRLYLYTVTPPSALGDNAAFDLPAGDRASFLGYIDLGTPVDLGSTLYVEGNILNKEVNIPGRGIFGYLVTNGGYTPTANRVYVIELQSVVF
jgi:hypothetical protein